MDLVEECCKQFEDDLEGVFYKFENISESDKKAIAPITFTKNEEKFNLASNAHNDWPSGRGLFSNKDQTFYIHANNYDHMEITFIKENISVQEFLDRFMDILAQIQLVETF
jgi:creatine kinase